MARFSGDPSLVKAIRDGVREMHRAHAADGQYDGHELINWLHDNRNDELNEIYDLYEDWKDPEMTADQQIGKFLYELGQEKIGEQTSPRRIGRGRNGDCQVSIWAISVGSALGNPRDKFAHHDEGEDFVEDRLQEAIHAVALRNAAGRMEEMP